MGKRHIWLLAGRNEESVLKWAGFTEWGCETNHTPLQPSAWKPRTHSLFLVAPQSRQLAQDKPAFLQTVESALFAAFSVPTTGRITLFLVDYIIAPKQICSSHMPLPQNIFHLCLCDRLSMDCNWLSFLAPRIKEKKSIRFFSISRLFWVLLLTSNLVSHYCVTKRHSHPDFLSPASHLMVFAFALPFWEHFLRRSSRLVLTQMSALGNRSLQGRFAPALLITPCHCTLFHDAGGHCKVRAVRQKCRPIHHWKHWCMRWCGLSRGWYLPPTAPWEAPWQVRSWLCNPEETSEVEGTLQSQGHGTVEWHTYWMSLWMD